MWVCKCVCGACTCGCAACMCGCVCVCVYVCGAYMCVWSMHVCVEHACVCMCVEHASVCMWSSVKFKSSVFSRSSTSFALSVSC